MKEINTYDVHIRDGSKIIGHMSCSFRSEEVYIRDLYVLPKHRNKGLEEILLSKALDYATENNAKQTIIYCGAEPFCEDGQISLDQEVSWYERHGFNHDHDVMGIAPCMVRPAGSSL